MDPVLLVAEWWWIAPVAAGGVAAGAITMRRRTMKSGRRLAYDAARQELRQAQQLAAERRMAAKLARAEYVRIAAERSARRATPEQVAGAKRLLRDKENDAKAAIADVRAKQVRVSAARAAIPAASAPRPLERLQTEHDAITARWMRYETDAALQIAYPAMTDVKQPATAAYLRAASVAVDARYAATATVAPAEYSAYRDAVAELERAFEAAEHAAKVQAGEVPAAATWQDAAQDVLSRSAEAIDKAAGAAASALAAWTERRRPTKD
ncbi:hypothetical protein [Microbacterium sp. NPDC089695]|uniref:hypothetical protein n=1 Tax=Microbacterium sp. NPDC089695 TaxID=3364198 RepID=UPI0037F40EC9